MDVDERSANAELERRLSGIAPVGESADREDWDRLAELESDLWARVAEFDRTHPAFAADPSHPALGSARNWRHALDRLGLDAEAREIDGLLEELILREAEGFRDSTPPGELDDSPGECFDALVASARLDGEALLHGKGGTGEPGPLREHREELRAAFLRGIASHAPSAASRKAWTDRLVDCANDVLSSIDLLPPRLAAEYLADARDDVAWHAEHVEREGEQHRRLKGRFRRLRAERQERLLLDRLEKMFGSRLVALWERGIIAAIFMVVGLLVLPAVVTLTGTQERWLVYVDTALCAFFLWDFSFKAILVRGDLIWIRRHVLTDFLPSLPFGLFLLDAGAADNARAGLLLRLLRLPRLARYLRVLVPLIRLARALGFLARGLDRMMRRYGHLLDHSVIVHPTPDERRRVRAAREGEGAELWRLRARTNRVWRRTLERADTAEQRVIAAARLSALRASLDQDRRPPDAARVAAADGKVELVAEELLERLSGVTAEELTGELGADFVSRVAAAVRTVAGSPLHWLPLLRSYAPRLPADMPDAEVAARTVRGLASRLQRRFRLVQWFADFYGTVTPSGLVGRVGTTLVRRTTRPASRLLLFGGIYLVASLILSMADNQTLQDLIGKVNGVLGPTLLVLGSVCLLLLVLGVWLQRLAKDSSVYYAQIAAAQFQKLTDSIKIRHHDRDAELIEQRVFHPERALRAEDGPEASVADREFFQRCVRAWLTDGRPLHRDTDTFDALARTVLLYRDHLDGALLGESDTRTTGQLLGNLALRRIRADATRMGRQEIRALESIDLERRKAYFSGPYLWFNFISSAMTQSSARLIVEYNENAIPLEELDRSAPETLASYREWLSARDGDRESMTRRRRSDAPEQRTTAFTTLHFLDDAPVRDAEIERRFGPEVLQHLCRDRRAMFRRVFGSYPLHLLPVERRVFNLRRVYRTWIEGGRVLFLPLRLLWVGCSFAAAGGRFLWHAIERVRYPQLAFTGDEVVNADFSTAVRKIDRMRGPGAEACLWQRALVDAEYLGVGLPGDRAPELVGSSVDVDLDFLNARREWREKLAVERLAAAADMERLSDLVARGLVDEVARGVDPNFALDREHLRAVAVAYRADYGGLRSHLSCTEVLSAVYADASGDVPLPRRLLPRIRLWRAFRRYWREHGIDGEGARLSAWRATVHDRQGAAQALRVWARLGPERARDGARELLARVLRHPAQITEQLVTLRAVQTISLIDIRNYRTHVWALGGYAETGEDPGASFRIGDVGVDTDPTPEPRRERRPAPA